MDDNDTGQVTVDDEVDAGPLPHADESPPSAPDEPADAPPDAQRRRRRLPTWVAAALSVFAAVLILLTVAGFVIHVPYVIISPGEATPLDSRVITVDGAPTYGHGGNVLFLTVRVTNHDPTIWRVVASWLNSDREVIERDAAVGCLSDDENATINKRLMQQSQDDAKNVALTRLGYSVEAEPMQVTVVEVCSGAPAYGKLEAGDRVLAIDDQPVDSLDDVRPLVNEHRPGDVATVTYSRDDTTETTKVTTGRVSGTECLPAGDKRTGSPCLGVKLQPFVTYRFPIDVTIDTKRVSGPSAGLAFTLAIIDDLTPGDLTGGKRVAVTGTISPEGRVGPVGGVEQKAITARHNDVELMLVPRSELKDARAGSGDVRVVGVDTIDEALDALQQAGGSPVPPTSTVAARS
jgi:PDZ domain-containing protein